MAKSILISNVLPSEARQLIPSQIKVEYNDMNSTEVYNRFISEVAAGGTTAGFFCAGAGAGSGAGAEVLSTGGGTGVAVGAGGADAVAFGAGLV